MSLEQSQGQYRQLTAILRRAIESGEYPPGSMLPSEDVLCERYGVTRGVVNKAIRPLRAWGLVRVQRGKGTMVRELQPIHRNAVARYQQAAREHAGAHGAFDTEIRSLGLEPRSDTTVDVIGAPADVAESLGLEPGARVVRRDRKMYVSKPGGSAIPVQRAPSYIPAEIAEGTQLAEVDSGPGGIISRFAELGHEQVRITESVRARPSEPAEREFLQLDDDEPVLEIRHTGWTAAGRPVELAVHIVPASLWILDFEFPTS